MQGFLHFRPKSSIPPAMNKARRLNPLKETGVPGLPSGLPAF
jgi:hypothetical protein